LRLNRQRLNRLWRLIAVRIIGGEFGEEIEMDGPPPWHLSHLKQTRKFS
jgi:hypothetical protein